jgi:hypothetical protein
MSQSNGNTPAPYLGDIGFIYYLEADFSERVVMVSSLLQDNYRTVPQIILDDFLPQTFNSLLAYYLVNRRYALKW